jgi:hypothetical protein
MAQRFGVSRLREILASQIRTSAGRMKVRSLVVPPIGLSSR